MPPKLPPFCFIYKCLVTARKASEYKNKKENGPDDLQGFCAKGALILWKLLRQYNIKSSFTVTGSREDGCHIFLKLGEYRLDVTATQFGNAKHLITEKYDTTFDNEIAPVFTTYAKFIEYLKFIKWNKDEYPPNYRLSKIHSWANIHSNYTREPART